MQPRDKKLRPHFALVVATMVVLGLAHGWVNPWLGFDRGAIEQGQLWRLLTCHLVHLNHWHMLLNLAGLVLCGYFFTDLLDRVRFWSWLLFCGLVTGLALYFLDTGLQHYVGLSGILHGLLVYCLLQGWRGNPWLHSLVLLVIAGRIVSEQQAGYDVEYLRSWIAGRVYVNAHLYGALAGVLLFGGITGVEYGRKRRTGNTERR
ncbi:rhombosortase [Alcanivorax sp.]|uniref:rhombosortase n=1 Tax=Alcanivorax sp. TaxID=1872427 RepID=UPI000C434AB3|nr:rhombosortase [Alcanivorax sp.]MBU83327.1 rhombosortase [Alcanivorax sp.]